MKHNKLLSYLMVPRVILHGSHEGIEYRLSCELLQKAIINHSACKLTATQFVQLFM